jgi:hypothetical protein
VGVHWQSVLEDELGKCLTKADSLTTQEGPKGERVSLSTIWFLDELRARVESLREELIWSLPLSGISMHGLHVDEESIAGHEGHSIDSARFGHRRGGGNSEWGVESHDLVVGLLEELEILSHLKLIGLDPVMLDLVDKWIHLRV